MSTTTSTNLQHKPARRIKQVLLRAALSLVVIAVLVQLMYTFSGSSQWDNLGERNGVTLYSMKSPGSNFKKFKATWTVHSRLSKFVMFAHDSVTDLGVGYYDVNQIEKPDGKIEYTAWKKDFPKPFKTRQFVVKTEFSQNPETKELLYTVTATPDKIPKDQCCFRIPVMNNSWRLTPLGNNDLRIEWYVDMDMGLSYLMANPGAVHGLYDFAPKLQGLLDRKLYANAKYDWLQEGQP